MVQRILNKIRSLLEEKETDKYSKQLAIDSSAILLPGTKFDFRQPPENRTYITVGEKCLIKSHFVFESEKGSVTIGKNVYIGGVTLISRTSIEIQDNVTMAWGITVYDHNSHSVNWEERKNDNQQCYNDYKAQNGGFNKDWSNVISKPIKICSKAWIGFDVLILKGVTIGEGAVVGARSIVTKDVEPWTVVAGNPAVIVKKLK